jgi:hypothetical protein
MMGKKYKNKNKSNKIELNELWIVWLINFYICIFFIINIVNRKQSCW